MEPRKKVWFAFGFSLVAYAYLMVTYEEPEKCSRTVYASDVSRWIDEVGGQVDYTGGKWYNKDGVLIATSATEDSDLCVK
jgi:hypothetical protein